MNGGSSSNFTMSSGGAGGSDISPERRLVIFWMNGIGGVSICLVGVICNGLALAVLSTARMRNCNTNRYLIALGVVDTLNLISSFLIAVKDLMSPFNEDANWEYWMGQPAIPWLFLIFHPLAILFQVCSVWLTVAFTLDRYYQICHPFRAERICSGSLSLGVIATVIVMCTLYNIPRFLEYEPYHVDNETTWFHLTPLGRSESFQLYYHMYSWVVLIVLIPLVAISSMNIFLIREIRRSNLRMHQLAPGSVNHSELHKKDTNVMLVSVIFLFLICQLPAAVSHAFWWHIDPTGLQLHFLIFNEFANLFILVNSALNIVPYYLFGRKFRRHFRLMFCFCCIGGGNENGRNQDQLPRRSVVYFESKQEMMRDRLSLSPQAAVEKLPPSDEAAVMEELCLPCTGLLHSNDTTTLE